jgi:hypothetical protein
LLILRELSPLAKCPRLLCRGNLRLPCLSEKLMGLSEITAFDLRLRSFDEVARQPVLRVQCGKLRLSLLILTGNLSQFLWELFKRHVLLAENAQ